MTDRELMQQALDALEHTFSWSGEGPRKAVEALRARLAQPEQEIESDRDHVEDDGCPTEKAVLQRFWREHQKQEHSEQWWKHEVSNAWAAGYEKGRASVKQPEQEPVAWGIANTRPTEKNPLMMVMLDEPEPSHLVVPLYTAPPQREWQGLTKEDKREIIDETEAEDRGYVMALVEAKLKDKNA